MKQGWLIDAALWALLIGIPEASIAVFGGLLGMALYKIALKS